MIELERVSKFFAGQPAVIDFSLGLEKGEFCCLIGPSGCGKTTTLKMINRMVEASSGVIRVGGRRITEFRPHELRRSMGYVIQSIGLFPHMNVLQNICVVPRLLKWDQKRAQARAKELLELFQMSPEEFRHKYPHELSGGQAQRIGVARALAVDPDILLMDEPFGALDPISRANLQKQLARIQKELGKTVVFVTHDVDEAVSLASRVVLMQEGRIVQVDSPERMLYLPGSGFVERFLGTERSLKRLSRLKVREALSGQSGDDAEGSAGSNMDAGEARNPSVSVRLLQQREAGSGQAGSESDAVLDADSDLRHALAVFLQQGRSRLPVREENGRIIGEVSLVQLLGV